MKKLKLWLTVLTVMLITVMLASTVSADTALPFDDVPEKSWYTAYVADVYAAGIMKGKDETTFDPAGVVSRAEFVTALARLSGESMEGYEKNIESFSDANIKKWYAKYMGWGVSVGLVKGQGAGKLAPNAPVTRAEMATLMARFLEYLDVTLPRDPKAVVRFYDVPGGKYYTEAAQTLRACGLLNGDGTGKLNPADTSQRHSMAALVSRYLDKKETYDLYHDEFAVININTETGGDVTSKEDYIRASFTLTDPDGRDINEGSMRIRGRGNSTWNMEKKSYRLKFDENICLMSPEDGWGTKNKDWTLLANHCDKSLIRNHMTQEMGRELDGIDWSPYTELVEVYLNGEYRGVYMLCEQVEVGDGRVEIEEGEKDDIGFLLELDNYADGEYLIDYVTILGQKYSIKSDIKDKDQAIALKLYMETLMSVAKEGDKAKVERYFDMDSTVDMYLLHEIMRNVDTGYSSFYMYIPEPHGKLYFTAPWDFDLSTGNTTASPEPTGIHVAHCMDEDGGYLKTVNTWFAALMQHQWFRELVRDRYNEKREALMEIVDGCCDFAYTNMDSLDRNFDKWKVMAKRINQEPDNVLKLGSCTKQVEFLNAWIHERDAWLTEYYNSDKFIKDYNLTPDSEKTYGRTDVTVGDVWTIPDWYEGYSEAQIIVDTMIDCGIVQLKLGRAATMTPESMTRRIIVDNMGLEKGRFVIDFNMDEFNSLHSQYEGVGFGDAAHRPIHFVVRDLKTGETSEETVYVFHVTKEDLTDLWPDD